MHGNTFAIAIIACAGAGLSISPAFGQSELALSVPEPTRLHRVALADESRLVWSERVGSIESSDARADVSVVEFESGNDERIRGAKITLENATASDHIFLTERLLLNLQAELEHLEFTRQFYDKCEAKHMCIHGIARCRPSQTEIQAYCPSRFSTPDSEEGLNLSTPRHSFKFPAVGARQLDALMDDATQALEARDIDQ